ncbi:MAG: hypothetical protein E7598_06655 [Ruminococcaceae bacterium]|nr:hypothetical protein [Oscillospiraceae bacterium]
MAKKPLVNEAPPENNEYYLRISKKLRNTKYLMLLLMVAALIFTLWAYRSRLTYGNFRYLLRDIDEAGHTSLSTDAVYYTANDTNAFLHFRGDLAVGSSDGISFHRALGSRSFEDKVVFKSPVLAGSDKYMIAYDSGGKTFYVYNSISRVYSETLPHAIIDIAAADNGNFAVLTKSDVGDFVIRVYDKNFSLVGEVNRSGFVYSLDFPENDRIFFAETYVSEAAIYSDALFYTVGQEDVEKAFTVQGLIFDITKTKSGYAVLFDGGIEFYDESYAKTDSHSFGTSDVVYGDKSKRGICVLLDTNRIGTSYSVFAAFDDGSSFTAEVDPGARGAVLCKDAVCVLYDEYLLVCNADKAEKTDISDGAKALLKRDDGSVIVCYNDYAKVYEVK